MLTDEQLDFLDTLDTPVWTAQRLAEGLAAGEKQIKIKNPRYRQLTLKGKDIEDAIRYLNPKLSDWLDSRHLLKK